MNKAQPPGRAFPVFGRLFEKGNHPGAANKLRLFYMWTRKHKPSDWRERNTRHANTKHTDCKRLGEASEAEFLARAARLFFRLAKPWGESDPSDALVAIGRGFWGGQVKCPYPSALIG